MFPLTTTHLRFVCEATTPLHLEVENFRAGQNLRGALGQVMTRTYCAETLTPNSPPVLRLRSRSVQDATGEGSKSAHAATCPVHWLLAASEKPGQERRGYTLVPPAGDAATGAHDTVKPNERFEFGLTLFGNALQFLPYFVLAVPEMGRLGVGAGRGKFALSSVWAENPFTRERECLLAEGDNLVHTPTLTITHSHVLNEAERLLRNVIASTFAALSVNSAKQSPSGSEIASSPSALLAMTPRVTIQFVTPTRLIEESKLVQAPAFEVLFARLLKRLDDLAEQFGKDEGGTLRVKDEAGRPRRPQEEIQSLQRIAEQVRLVESETRWVEVFSGSSRRGTTSPLSGIVGRAAYAATPEVWSPLLPWLLWGQLAQVGKSTVKGNGVVIVN
ncbi:MAG: CRISPR system precrRNA processing endoribonuclease RAMP protein Cas6 [Chloroflexota bacterium]|nr:CRISPR system precrRNA processing endoribonuclease RAMP protein Cas6 [Chloroflexota bacterium]